MRLLRSENRQLPCDLTRDELLDRATQSALLKSRMGSHLARVERIKLELKEKAAEIEQAQAVVDEQLRSRSERRPVQVTVIADDKEKKVFEIRDDTGKVIGARPMTPHEAQIEIGQQSIAKGRQAALDKTIQDYLARLESEAEGTAGAAQDVRDLLLASYPEVEWPTLEELSHFPATARLNVQTWAAGAALWEEAPGELESWIRAHNLRLSIRMAGVEVDGRRVLDLTPDEQAEVKAWLQLALDPTEDAKPEPPECLQ